MKKKKSTTTSFRQQEQISDGNELDEAQDYVVRSPSSYNEALIPETLSASVDLEDIIDSFDGTSRLSLSASLASLSKLIQSSQTYFSANNESKIEETTSFYSALQDGFSLDDFGQPSSDVNFNPNASQQEILWADSVVEQSYTEKDILMSPSDFQVYWNDLNYTIRPKITLFTLWFDLEQRFKSNLAALFRSSLAYCGCNKSEKYIINEYPTNHDEQRSRSAHNNNTEKNYDDNNNNNLQNEPITIIQHSNGSFKSGELTGVMGPSGAGKTSLLNCLSRRQEEGYSGELYVDTTSNRRLKISTIPQCDHLPEYLTVRENLLFASCLKNTQLINFDHEKNVERVSNLLGLDHCLDTRTKKISGGQHKRLAIAQELVSKPDILILDEPTSGLDSLTCYKTITVLKNLVQASAKKLIDPIAIVLTIHQPQQEVFDIFDKIYVMANGGITIYNGPPDKCIEFVEKYAGIQVPDKDYNPASFLIEIASGEYGLEPIKKLEKQVRLEYVKDRVKPRKEFATKSVLTSSSKREKRKATKQQQVGEIFEKSNKVIDEENNNNNNNDYDDEIINANKERTKELASSNAATGSSIYIDHRIAKGSSMNVGSFWLKTQILSKRCWFSILRDPKQMIGRILFHITLPIALALIMGKESGRANACPKFKSEYELKSLIDGDTLTNKDVQEELFLTLENIGCMFILMYALTSANIAATTLSFTLDMQSSLKEFYNGWYSMPSYLVARIISTLPMELVFPIITLSLSYPLTGQMTGHGLSDTYRILITAGAIILGSLVGQTIGMVLGAIYIGHVSTALFASQASILPFVFLSGFVVRTKNMSKFVYALSQTSFYKHALEIAALARYGFDVCDCQDGTISGKDAIIVGIPDNFNKFAKYWLTTFAEDPDDAEESITTTTISSLLSTVAGSDLLELSSNSTEIIQIQDENKKDLFELFAKQVSLYNTYGINVRSCQDIKPFQLHDLSLSEKDIPSAFIALVTLLIVAKILLFLTVKLTVHYRTSL